MNTYGCMICFAGDEADASGLCQACLALANPTARLCQRPSTDLRTFLLEHADILNRARATVRAKYDAAERAGHARAQERARTGQPDWETTLVLDDQDAELWSLFVILDRMADGAALARRSHGRVKP